MIKKVFLLLITSASILIVTGCGMKGPLEEPQLAQLDQNTVISSNIK